MHMYEADALSSSHRLRAETHYSVPARARRIDYLVRRLRLFRLDVIKMDVEGCEYDALLGMRFLPRSMTPVIFMEFNALTLTCFGNVSPRMVLEYVIENFSDVETAQGEQISGYHDQIFDFVYRHIMHRACADDLIFKLKR